jgi:hypothetical protein
VSSSSTYTDYYFVRLLKLSPFERARAAAGDLERGGSVTASPIA